MIDALYLWRKRREKREGERSPTNTCCLTDDTEEYLVGHLDRGAQRNSFDKITAEP